MALPSPPARVLPPHSGADAALPLLSATLDSHSVESLVLDRDLTGTGPGFPLTRLFLALPRDARPGGAVLYLLDGNAAFDFLTPALLAQWPGLALVGVGYDTEKQFARPARVFDYSPPAFAGAPPREDPHHPGRMAGGAGSFRARLLGPVRCAAESRLPAPPGRRTLWGHSFGGLFTLYCAATAPRSFDRYAAISPSVWWDEPLIRSIVAGARFGGQRLYLGVGDREQRSGSAAPPPQGPPAGTLAMADLLAAKEGLSFRSEIYPGAVHIAALPASLPAALALAAGE